MQSIEKLFALVDRKVDRFSFILEKVKGEKTGNEYYAVGVECIIGDENFESHWLTTGCPANVIRKIVNEILEEYDKKKKKVILKPVSEEPLVKLAPCNESSNVRLRRIEPVIEDEGYDTVVCECCGAVVNADYSYCPYCGADL